MAQQFLYTRPSDALMPSAALSVNSGTEDSEYPAENIGTSEPQVPAKLTTTSGSWVADLGGATQVDGAAIIHHNLDVGLLVKLQGHTANSWATPDVDLTFTIPAAHLDGFSVNPWLDLTALVPLAANRTKRYWRLFISGTNSAPVAIGNWRLEAALRGLGDQDDVEWGARRGFQRPAKIHETDTKVRKRYDLGTTLRTFEAEVIPRDDALADLRAWFRDAQGAVQPFLIIPQSDEDDIWLVTFAEPEQQYTEYLVDYSTVSIRFLEVSRGLAL